MLIQMVINSMKKSERIESNCGGRENLDKEDLFKKTFKLRPIGLK